jgi:hypothetical protein
MWKPRWYERIRENYKLSKYRARLSYAIERLEKPRYDDLGEEERQYKLEIVRWLLAYYIGDTDATGEGTPEIRLIKTLRKKAHECTTRDHVYAGILFNWKEYKRIEGY